MYRRYSQTDEMTMPVPQARRNRIKNVLIAVLAVALIVAVAVMLPQVRSRAGIRGVLVQRMQNEISTASRLTASLSRSAGASSSATLAQIRSNIYSIAGDNEISIALDGASGRLLQEEELTSLLSSIDNYLAFLTTGMDTGEYQTNLQNALDALQMRISALE